MIGYNPVCELELKGIPLNLKYEKMKKSIFSIDKANISQLFLLDKLVSGQGLIARNIFLIATLYRKIDRKVTFDFMAL